MSVTHRAMATHGARLEQKTTGNARQTRQASSGRNLEPGPGPPEVSLIYNPGSKQNGIPNTCNAGSHGRVTDTTKGDAGPSGVFATRARTR